MSLFHRKKEEEDLIPPYGLGGYVSDPPQGGDATIPVTRGGQSNDAFLRLMKWTEQEINARLARERLPSPSDASYYEPQATYPPIPKE